MPPNPLYTGKIDALGANVRNLKGEVVGKLISGTKVWVYELATIAGWHDRAIIDLFTSNNVWATRIIKNVMFKLLWPVKGQPHTIGQRFGANPQNYAKFGLPGHEGIDLFAPLGSDIVACADGIVKLGAMALLDYPQGPAYGNQVRITHADGYETIYAHLNDIVVTVGQRVKSGDLLGHADNTGNSFGNHLHLTVKHIGSQTPGYPVGIIDPEPLLIK